MKATRQSVGSVAERLAKEYGVSARTVERDGQFYEAVKFLDSMGFDIERRIWARERIPSRKDIIWAAKNPEYARAILNKANRRGKGERQ